jgi:pilus assembly protein CpaD
MHHDNPAVAGRRSATTGVASLLIVCLALALGGCNTTARDTTGDVPNDYRERHAIRFEEGRDTLVLFVGPGRGGLTPMQRAEVLAFAQNWKQEATGGVIIDRPVGSANDRAAQDALKEARSIIVHAGIPNHGIVIRPYNASGNKLAALQLNYPKTKAVAGPCGFWPDDLGPTYDPKYIENKQHFNFGCATQKNLAAMVANPADLVQPRAETPVYAAKRTVGIDKWRKGESPATNYPDADKAKVSSAGK